MSILLDTNILLRTAQPRHAMLQAAKEAVSILLDQCESLCIVPQVLIEFWAVGTRPLSLNGLGLSTADAEAKIAQIKATFLLLDDSPEILREWESLVVKLQVIGKNAHDAHLVAAMVVHGLPRILTINSKDFQRYPMISSVSPEEVAQVKPP